MRKRIRLATLALVLALPLIAGADDGMWMPHQMKDLNLKALGLRMNPDDLYGKDGTGLMSAVVNLGGGTGGFVSPELQRSISVDIRYVLWVTDKFSGATHIIEEMGLR